MADHRVLCSNGRNKIGHVKGIKKSSKLTIHFACELTVVLLFAVLLSSATKLLGFFIFLDDLDFLFLTLIFFLLFLDLVDLELDLVDPELLLLVDPELLFISSSDFP